MNKIIRYTLYIICYLLIIIPIVHFTNLYITTGSAVDNSFGGIERNKSDLRDDNVEPTKDSINILLLGIDYSESREEAHNQSIDRSRTDSIILVTLDNEDKEVRMTNIPRDTFAFMKEQNFFDKITHAHAYGGPEASMDSVESLLNVPVDYYARVNMKAVVEIVDELGGIEYDVPFDMNEPNSMDKGRIELEEGLQHLNGEETLAIARSRKYDGDLARGARQVDVVQKIIEKAKSTGALDNMDEILEIIQDNSQHNFSFKEIQSLASYYAFNTVDFKKEQLEGDNYQPGNVYYYKPDPESLYTLSKKIRKDIHMDKPNPLDFINIRIQDYVYPYYFVTPEQHEYVPEALPEEIEEDFPLEEAEEAFEPKVYEEPKEESVESIEAVPESEGETYEETESESENRTY